MEQKIVKHWKMTFSLNMFFSASTLYSLLSWSSLSPNLNVKVMGKFPQNLKRKVSLITSLKLTFSLKMDSWKMDPFFGGPFPSMARSIWTIIHAKKK